MRTSTAGSQADVAALEQELALIQRQAYIEQAARGYRLGTADRGPVHARGQRPRPCRRRARLRVGPPRDRARAARRRSTRGRGSCSATPGSRLRLTPRPAGARPPSRARSAGPMLDGRARERHRRADRGAAGRRTGRVGRPRMITIPIEDWVFGVAALVGGVLLLVTVVFDDILGGLLDGFGFDIAGTSFTPILLGFIGMFGAGGLFATQVLDLHGAQAAIVGVISGVGGAALAAAPVQRPQTERVRRAVQARGPRRRRRCTCRWGSRPNRYGSVLASGRGRPTSSRRPPTGTSPAGRTVKVTGVAGNGLIVQDERRGRRAGERGGALGVRLAVRLPGRRACWPS